MNPEISLMAPSHPNKFKLAVNIKTCSTRKASNLAIQCTQQSCVVVLFVCLFFCFFLGGGWSAHGIEGHYNSNYLGRSKGQNTLIYNI